MSRKMSPRERKRRRLAAAGIETGFNAVEWLNAIQRCQPYTSELPPGAFVLEGTQTAATKSMLKLRAAYDALKKGEIEPCSPKEYDSLVNAFGEASVRAVQIAGEHAETNPLLAALVAGNSAMRRCIDRRRRLGKWGLDGPGLVAVLDAIEVYEVILQASSPEQMVLASKVRHKALAGAMAAPLNAIKQAA